MSIAKINGADLRKALKFAGSVTPSKFRTVIPVLGMADLSGEIQVSGADRRDPFRALCEDPNPLRVIMPMRV